MASARKYSMLSAHVDPGQEVTGAICRVAISEFGERLGHPVMRVDVGDLAVLDQRGDDRPVVAALAGACEQGVLAVEGQVPDRPLDGIGVELNAPIVEEYGEPVPAGERIAYRFGQLALGADLADPGLEKMTQIIDDDTGVFVADLAAMLGTCAAHLTLDGVKPCDALQQLGGNRRLVGEIEEIAPEV